MKHKLLLHSCCASCSSSVIERLQKYFDVTVFYYNPNIYPKTEYEKRLKEQKKYLQEKNIPMIEGEYDVDKYLEFISDFKDLKEKSVRCYHCYKFRLQKTFEIAQKLNFDYFTTTLSVSPHKNFKWINEIGLELQKKDCLFYGEDFKKKDGYLRSVQLSKINNFYRQNYCGCEMSYLNSKH